MLRRTFIKQSVLTTLGVVLLPSFMNKNGMQEIGKALLMGKGKPDFLGSDFKLEQNTFNAFIKMKAAAAKVGINIEVVSAYRSYERQLQIWTRKYKQFTQAGLSPIQAIEKIIEYSTVPGTSRHHWGTDIDLIDGNAPRPDSVLEARHFHGKGPFCKFKEWMNLHANSYGFYEVYTDHPNRKGFKYEPWHFSYKPTSLPYLQAYKKLDVKKELQREAFIGTDYFTESFVERYIQENIMDINPELKS